MKVRSTLGKGSVFSVTIPLAPIEAAAAESVAVEPLAPVPAAPVPAAPIPAPAPAAAARMATLADAPVKEGEIAILVIDDDSFVLSAISMFLTSAGHRVVGASTVAEGLRAVEDGSVRPDAVIADYHLSATENGLDFIAELWTRLGLRIPAVLISGRLDGAVTSRAAEMGVTVASKPIMPDRLSTLVAAMTASRPALSVAGDTSRPA